MYRFQWMYLWIAVCITALDAVRIPEQCSNIFGVNFKEMKFVHKKWYAGGIRESLRFPDVSKAVLHTAVQRAPTLSLTLEPHEILHRSSLP